MIAFLSGILKEKKEDHVIIQVGGIGFHVLIPLTTYRELPRIGAEITIHTHLFMREDELRLYGFATVDERELFLILLGISGIGAKMAIDIISHISVSQLVDAVQNDRVQVLCQVPGIGKKRGERLIFDLKNVKHPLFLRPAVVSETKSPQTAAQSQTMTEAVEALMALGIKLVDAQRAVTEAATHLGEDADVSTLIKEGLKYR